MRKNRTVRQAAVLPRGGSRAVVELKLSQVRPDPNQPRKHFDRDRLTELIESIKSQKMQQLPTVNYSHDENGEPVYVIKAGERRYRAHEHLKRDTILVVVEPEVYSGKFDVARTLAQAAENSSREPHTHAEIIHVMKLVIEEERQNRGDKMWGLYESALGRVAKAFGKSRAWALNYRVLVDLHPDLVSLLDDPDPDTRLNFTVACSLARLPHVNQTELLKQANGLRQKGGVKLMVRFIAKQADDMRNRGVVSSARSRVPSDDKKIFMNTCRSLNRLSLHLVAERRSSEYRSYVNSILGQMNTLEVDQMLANLNSALVTFNELATSVKRRREVLYARFK